MGLKLLFVLVGAFAGGVLGSASGTLALAVLGGLVGWWWPRNEARPSSSFDASTLLRRVIALERELALLRGSASESHDGTPPQSAVDAKTPAPDPVVAAPAKIVDIASVPLVTPVASASAPLRTPARAPAPAREPRRAPAPPAPSVLWRDRLPPFAARWIFGGNTIVKAGVLILFLGLAFLLRYTAERVTLPLEVRYAGVALVGLVLAAIGWRLRDRRDAAGGTGYGLILQGAGIGVFYLTTLGAQRLDPLLTPALAFAFMALVAAIGALLAVLQDAPWLAFVSIAEGFAAPALVSTGSAAYVPLMSYLAILDAGILAMAWFKTWRPLNLVGAVATFALAGAWAHAHYVAADYAGVQAFLAFFFLLFTLAGVLFARRALAAGDAPDGRPLAQRAAEALRHVGRVDSTLTFGVPLAAFTLQYLLVRDFAWGPAWAAAAFALFHIALGGVLMRGASPRYALLGEAHVIVGTIFATLAIPLALQGAWTGATWAVEAAGMYWLGARQRRTYARAFALLVILGAALRLADALSPDLRPGVPLLAGSTLGMAMLAAALCAMDIVRRRVADDARGPVEEIAAVCAPFAAAGALATLAWMLCPMLWAGTLTAWIAYGCAASANRLAAPSLRVASVLLHLGALTAMTLSLQLADGASTHAWQDLVAALAIGAALLATGWLGLRDAWREAGHGTPAPVPLGNSVGLVLGLAVASASLLFELAPANAALAWPVIGLAAAWAGRRLRSGALVGSGLGLQVAAGLASLAFEPSVWMTAGAVSALAPTLRIPLLLTIAGLVLGDRLRERDDAARAWWQAPSAQWALVAWVLVWWSRTLPPVIWRALDVAHAPGALETWPHWQLIWATLTAAAAVAIARWRDWRVLGQASLAAVPLWILAAAAASRGVAPSAHLGWLAWLLALAAHPWLGRMQRRWCPHVLAAPLRLLGWWLFIALAVRECTLRVESIAAAGSAWVVLAAMAVPALVLIASAQPALLRRCKDAAARAAWLGAGCLPLALYLFLWLWAANTGAGDAAPLPWLPLLNPLETGAGIALLAIVGWLRALPSEWRALMPPQAPSALGGATAFAVLTGMVLRMCHHWAGVQWSAHALFASTLAQAALSVAWSLIGVALMVAGHRGARRAWWASGAALLAVVVAKLFLVELADRASLERIVSFIVVGGLMLAVGYFAPIPPRRDDDAAPPDTVGEPA
jgi:uncharacterized membrane protein